MDNNNNVFSQSVSQPVNLSVSQSICQSVNLSVSQSVNLSVSQSGFWQPVNLSVIQPVISVCVTISFHVSDKSSPAWSMCWPTNAGMSVSAVIGQRRKWTRVSRRVSTTAWIASSIPLTSSCNVSDSSVSRWAFKEHLKRERRNFRTRTSHVA